MYFKVKKTEAQGRFAYHHGIRQTKMDRLGRGYTVFGATAKPHCVTHIVIISNSEFSQLPNSITYGVGNMVRAP